MIYQTQDTVASVRRAYQEFTHVVVNRSYHIIKPVMMRTGQLSDLPVFIYQPWKAGWERQVETWRAKGGVMVDASDNGVPIGRRDVTVIAEAPLNMRRLQAIQDVTDEYVVVNRPVSWKTHETAVDLYAPDVATLKAFRKAVKAIPAGLNARGIAAVSRYPESPFVCTDLEVAAALDLPVIDVATLRKSLNCQEVWSVALRLPPDAPALLGVWKQLETLPGTQKVFTLLEGPRSWRRALKEMERLGHIGLRRYYVYAHFEPNYKRLAEVHKTAQADFKAVRKLLAKAPEHLPSPPLSAESL